MEKKIPENLPAIGEGQELPDEAAIGKELAKAEQQGTIYMAALMAKRFPRDEEECERKLFAACKMDEFAGNVEDVSKPSAYYVFPRGGNMISGPSIRLAREINRIWGHVRTGLNVLEDKEDQRVIMGFAWDLQTNQFESVQDVVEKLIQRRIKQPDGATRTEWVKPDERDLRELVFRRGAILIRNAILALHPRYRVDKAVSMCKETVAGNSPEELARKRPLMLQAFNAWGITTKQIEKYLGKRVNEIAGNDLAELRGIYEALRDGQISQELRVEMFGRIEITKEPSGEERKPLQPEDFQPHPDQEPKRQYKKITPAQLKKLFATARKVKKTEKDLKDFVRRNYGLDSLKDVTEDKFDDLLSFAAWDPRQLD